MPSWKAWGRGQARAVCKFLRERVKKMVDAQESCLCSQTDFQKILAGYETTRLTKGRKSGNETSSRHVLPRLHMRTTI